MNRINRASMIGALVAGLLGFVAISATQAATLVWTGGVDNAWSTPNNWLNAGVPATYSDGDAVVFDDTAFRTNVNISTIVAPGSILFSNSTAKLYTFTNSIITGVCNVVKSGAGTVNFGSTLTGGSVYTNSLLFSGGVLITNGALRFQVSTNSVPGNYDNGGMPIGFGTGAITINGSGAVLGFSSGFGSSIVVVLTNDIVIGTGGGTIDVPRNGTANPQHNLNGNIKLYGNLAITGGNVGTGTSNIVYRIMSPGVTKLYNSCTVTLDGASSDGNRKGVYSQNITQDSAPVTLTIKASAQTAQVEFSGDNTALTGGIILEQNTPSGAGTVIFTGTNVMGGTTMTVKTNAYAGLAFDFTPAVLSGMNFDDDAVLGIDSNSAVNINCSAGGLNKDIWLGSARGANYTGTLTPKGSVYKLGGGGTVALNPLVLVNTNALTGSRSLWVGNTNSLQFPGSVVLAASNDYTGGTVISGSKRGASGSLGNSLLISRAVGALGSGTIYLKRFNASTTPVLQFETPFQVFDNPPIVVTGQLGSASINTSSKITLQGDLTFYGTNALNIMSASYGQALMVFNQSASGKSLTFDSPNSRINQSYGLFDPISTANLPVTIGYRQDVNGIIVLSPGFTWANLVAGRTWKNTSTPNSGEWNGRSFAARGATQVIDGTGAFESGATNNWLGITPILMGSLVTNADGTYYANAGVKIARDIVIGSTFTVTVPSQGPGWTNNSSVGVVQELAGTISGTGNLALVTTSISANDGILPELVLSGTSVWSGGWSGDFQNSQRIATGPGGISIAGGAPIGFIRFNGNASLPTGNGGATAYLQALGRNNSGQFGFLLTGASSDQIYSLTNGMRFLLSGAIAGSLGAAGGRVTLTNSMVSIFSPTLVGAAFSRLLVRDANSVFTLGSAAGAVKFSTGHAAGTGISGYQSPAVSATVMADRPTGTNTLIKSGAGTLVLSNVVYTLFDGTGDVATNFIWQLGSATAGLFDGVVRETGTAISNSLRMSRFTMKGAVYGLSSDWSPTVGTSTGNCDVTGATSGSAFGFSAYGGNRILNLRPMSGINLKYNTSIGSNWYIGAVPLVLNAPDAEGELTYCASDVTIELYDANREFSVLSTNYAARIPAKIFDTAAGFAAGIIKTGPGRLILDAVTNTYDGVTIISNGTLTINGILSAGTNGISVYSGGTLDGTGTVRRAVTVASNATVSAGAGANLAGTLIISSNLVINGKISVDVSGTAAGQYDVISVGGAVTLTGTELVLVPALGYELPGGATITVLTASGGITGTVPIAPRGYSVQIVGNDLRLHRDSPGFIFRIQ